MIKYICIAVLMLPDYENCIISEMVKRGYKISAGLESGKTIICNTNGCSFLLSLMATPEKKNGNTIVSDFEASLNVSKAKYYGMIVFPAPAVGIAHMKSGNIILPEIPDGPSKSIMNDE